jgi:hypothetical protein
MTVHDFGRSLEWSHSMEDAPWWELVYRAAFPTMTTYVSVRGDGWAQRGGIDRLVVLGSGRVIMIDEKVRSKDYGDIFLEVWSDAERKVPGWAMKDLACDYVAYAFEPSATCYLLPFLDLRRALGLNKHRWGTMARKGEAGFSVRRAENRTNGRSWTTVGVCVPINELLAAIRDALVIQWGEQR